MFNKKCTVGLTAEIQQIEKYQDRPADQRQRQGWWFHLGTIQGVSAGSLLRRTDVIKTVLLWVFLCHIYPVTSCGVDPMRYVENYARIKGFESVDPVLNYMRLNTPVDYSTLMKEKEDFIACTRMVHTGYFKRSMEMPLTSQQLLPQRPVRSQQLLQNSGNKLSQILANKKNFNTGSYLEPGLGSQWLNMQQMGQLGVQDSIAGYENEALPSFLQRLKAIGQVSPLLQQSPDSFTAGEFYKGISKRRR